ncbi:hypothetical protein PFISCL1PPCAC_17534, partial [Pristionchus fissidentatus]
RFSSLHRSHPTVSLPPSPYRTPPSTVTMDDSEKTGLDDRNENSGYFGIKDKTAGSKDGALRWASREKTYGPIKYIKRPHVKPNKTWEPN